MSELPLERDRVHAPADRCPAVEVAWGVRCSPTFLDASASDLRRPVGAHGWSKPTTRRPSHSGTKTDLALPPLGGATSRLPVAEYQDSMICRSTTNRVGVTNWEDVTAAASDTRSPAWLMSSGRVS